MITQKHILDNIPIFRAKKIDSDEYVMGYLKPIGNSRFEILEHRILNNNDAYVINEIDPSTLAIHFPDMIDSEGTKIFASLSEDGKGGDILSFIERSDYSEINKHGEATLTFSGLHGLKYSFMITGKDRHYKKEDSKATGIQE